MLSSSEIMRIVTSVGRVETQLVSPSERGEGRQACISIQNNIKKYMLPIIEKKYKAYYLRRRSRGRSLSYIR